MSNTNLTPNTVNVNLFGHQLGFMKSVHATPNKEVDLKGISSTVTRTSYDDKYWAISFIFRSLGTEGQELVTHEIFDNPRDVAILEAINADTPITVTPVFTRFPRRGAHPPGHRLHPHRNYRHRRHCGQWKGH